MGPFNPGLPVEVPLWLAINLKQRQKCRVIPPEWMDVGKNNMVSTADLVLRDLWSEEEHEKRAKSLSNCFI